MTVQTSVLHCILVMGWPSVYCTQSHGHSEYCAVWAPNKKVGSHDTGKCVCNFQCLIHLHNSEDGDDDDNGDDNFSEALSLFPVLEKKPSHLPSLCAVAKMRTTLRVKLCSMSWRWLQWLMSYCRGEASSTTLHYCDIMSHGWKTI